MLKRGALLFGLLVLVACNVEDEDDDDDWDDDDHHGARFGPPRSRGPAAPTQKDRPGLTDPPPSSDAGESDTGPSPTCVGSVPESAASCAYAAGGMCFAAMEDACVCADCGEEECVLETRSRLCEPGSSCPKHVFCLERDAGEPSDAAEGDAGSAHGRLSTPAWPAGRLPRP